MLRTNHVALHSFAIFGASLIDILASLVGAYETDGFDGRMVTDEVHSYNSTWGKIILLSAHRILNVMWLKYLYPFCFHNFLYHHAVRGLCLMFHPELRRPAEVWPASWRSQALSPRASINRCSRTPCPLGTSTVESWQGNWRGQYRHIHQWASGMCTCPCL